MKIKSFDIPTIEEVVKLDFFNSNSSIVRELGDYRLEIGILTYSDVRTKYCIALSLNRYNTFNIYTYRFFKDTYCIDNEDENKYYKLEKWYIQAISNFELFWMDYITKQYLDLEEK